MSNANNKLFRDDTVHSTEKLSTDLLPNKSLALESVKPAGAVFYNTTNQCLYYSDGTVWRKLFGASGAGAHCLIDVDGDTFVCVDDGSDNDNVRVVATNNVSIDALNDITADGDTISLTSTSTSTLTGGVEVTSANNIIVTPGAATQTTIRGASHSAGTITGATVLTPGNSGTTYRVNQGSSGYNITLPAQGSTGTNPAMNFKFVLADGTDAGDIFIISSGTSDIVGSFDNAGTATAIVAVDNANFEGATAALGDTMQFSGLASGWWFTGRTTVSGGITTSGPP
uniref:Uncharacterized protein n=1 Tax=Marseillevirus LCMAC103 TaxID=2506604 RepID=A0A481YVF8_9VIRU|nr:MAG: hypothetical protein LCMAC103_03640 [Marseillevirus LCMAC103]